jgi:hypothetical protein
MEINPHLVDDSSLGGLTEFTTLTYEPDPGTQGWNTHTDIQDDTNWYLTGSEGTTTGCTQANQCTLAALTTAWDNDADADAADPAISTGVYFASGRVSQHRPKRRSTSSCSTPSRSTSSPPGCS